MHRGKPLALAVALAGLIGAGVCAVSVAQTEATPTDPQSGAARAAPTSHSRILVLVPVPYGQAADATAQDGTPTAPMAGQDPSALPDDSSAAAPDDPSAAARDDNGAATEDDAATPQGDDPATAPDTPHPRMLILVPVPQGSDASPDQDGSDNEDDDTTSSGRTLILVPQHTPAQLPPGVVSA